MKLYQIAVIIVSSIMIYQGLENFFKRKASQSFMKIFSRIIIWGSMIVIALYPKFTNTMAEVIGMKGNINAVILVGFLLVFLLIFKLLSAIERLEQQITQVTRDDSLKKLEK